MQKNNDLLNYSPEEIEQLLSLSEELQMENEQYRAENKHLQYLMNEQQFQIQTISSDNQNLNEELQSAVQELQKLNVENRNLNMKLYQAEQSQQNQVQKMLSERQELFLMIQRLEQRVQQLTEQNEMLNESDLQLKKAEELENRLKEKENHWKNEVKKYQEEALNAKKRADTAILQANNEKEEVIKRKSEYDKLIANQKKVVKEKAEQMNEQYRNRCQLIWLVVLLYNVLATIFTGYQSERVVADCAGAVMAVKNLCVNGFLKIVDLSEKVGSIVGKIEQSIASEIVSTLLNLIVFMAIPCGVLALLYFVSKFVMNVYKENCFDEISLFVVTVTIAVLVWFADFMPLNIILMLILSHILYIVVRWYVKSYKENHC